MIKKEKRIRSSQSQVIKTDVMTLARNSSHSPQTKLKFSDSEL